MKVLISGASGYIGSHLLKNIDHKKYQLAVLVRNTSQPILPGTLIINSNDTGWKTKVKTFNPDVVIHLAAHLTSGDDENQIDKLIESNIRFGSCIKICRCPFAIFKMIRCKSSRIDKYADISFF